jgi:hypothetical protein
MSNFYANQLKKVVNGKILGIATAKGEEEDGFFGLYIAGADGNKYVMWLLSDDEGNAPGSFAVQLDTEDDNA